jgi:hypothetical protein
VDVLKMTPETARDNYESDYALDPFPTSPVWATAGILASIDFALNQQRLSQRVSPDELIDYRFTGR